MPNRTKRELYRFKIIKVYKYNNIIETKKIIQVY